jgi:dTDP-4-dehydrorhamnose 3,5-epimerase
LVRDIELIQGERFIDDRGALNFFSNLGVDGWKRFYIVENHDINFIRAWHGHKNEAKLVVPISGTALIGTVQVDNWTNPSTELKIKTTILSAEKPCALMIPGGFANGFKNLSPNTKLMFFSSSTVEESKNDDYRFAWNYWNPWGNNFR